MLYFNIFWVAKSMVNVHRAKVFCQISHLEKVQLLLDKGVFQFFFHIFSVSSIGGTISDISRAA